MYTNTVTSPTADFEGPKGKPTPTMSEQQSARQGR